MPQYYSGWIHKNIYFNCFNSHIDWFAWHSTSWCQSEMRELIDVQTIRSEQTFPFKKKHTNSTNRYTIRLPIGIQLSTNWWIHFFFVAFKYLMRFVFSKNFFVHEQWTECVNNKNRFLQSTSCFIGPIIYNHNLQYTYMRHQLLPCIGELSKSLTRYFDII